MAENNTDSVNSLKQSETPTVTTSEDNFTTSNLKKSNFVFTEARKQNLLKANKARKEKSEYYRQLKEKYEKAREELDKLYNSQVENMASKSSSSSSTDTIKVEEVHPSPVKKNNKPNVPKRPVHEDSESDDVSLYEEELPKKVRSLQREKRKPVKIRKVMMSESESSSEEEYVAIQKPKRSLKKENITKKVHYYIDSDDEEDDESYRYSPPKTDRYKGHGLSRIGLDKVGKNSGCIF